MGSLLEMRKERHLKRLRRNGWHIVTEAERVSQFAGVIVHLRFKQHRHVRTSSGYESYTVGTIDVLKQTTYNSWMREKCLRSWSILCPKSFYYPIWVIPEYSNSFGEKNGYSIGLEVVPEMTGIGLSYRPTGYAIANFWSPLVRKSHTFTPLNEGIMPMGHPRNTDAKVFKWEGVRDITTTKIVRVSWERSMDVMVPAGCVKEFMSVIEARNRRMVKKLARRRKPKRGRPKGASLPVMEAVECLLLWNVPLCTQTVNALLAKVCAKDVTRKTIFLAFREMGLVKTGNIDGYMAPLWGLPKHDDWIEFAKFVRPLSMYSQ